MKTKVLTIIIILFSFFLLGFVFVFLGQFTPVHIADIPANHVEYLPASHSAQLTTTFIATHDHLNKIDIAMSNDNAHQPAQEQNQTFNDYFTLQLFDDQHRLVDQQTFRTLSVGWETDFSFILAKQLDQTQDKSFDLVLSLADTTNEDLHYGFTTNHQLAIQPFYQQSRQLSVILNHTLAQYFTLLSQVLPFIIFIIILVVIFAI